MSAVLARGCHLWFVLVVLICGLFSSWLSPLVSARGSRLRLLLAVVTGGVADVGVGGGDSGCGGGSGGCACPRPNSVDAGDFAVGDDDVENSLG